MNHLEKPGTPGEVLEHFGVKGMRWGVRKVDTPAPSLAKAEGVTMRRDGSIDILPGANLQRLVRSNGQSLPMKDVTYASINEYDNARYIKTIGGKGFFGGGRDTILSIQATKPIKAPSTDEATKIVSDLITKDSKFRESNTDILGRPINDKDLADIRKDPSGKTAQMWYWQTNQALTFDPKFSPGADHVQKTVRETMLAKGYNALRDENDASGISKAPVIIFNPQDSLKVVGKKQIDDKLRKTNKAKLKQYKKQGQDWVDSQLYSD